jgi:hypothetical protein
MAKKKKPDGDKISVDLEVQFRGTITVEMTLVEARALAEKVDQGSLRFDEQGAPDIDWAEAVNSLDGEIEDLYFEDPSDDDPGGATDKTETTGDA